MDLPIENLTPRQIVAELDRYIIGQNAAKKAVGVALRNRYRRQQLPPEERDDVMPKNILMIGPTGVGKTEIARRLAQLAKAPFVKVEATKFTEVGYVGRDVESMIRELAATAVRMVETEKMELVRTQAAERVVERLAELIEQERPRHQRESGLWFSVGEALEESETSVEDTERDRLWQARRKRLIRGIRQGRFEKLHVEVDVEEANNPFLQVFTPQGMEEMGMDLNQPGPFGSRTVMRRVPLSEARMILLEQEARRMTDRVAIQREAIYRAEQTGIIFIDEIDKVAGKSGGSGPDVSREGVQRDLLPVIEGSTVQSKFGPIKTDHILFIAAGAFHISKPSDLIPELQGRLPIRVELESLGEDDFVRILKEPKSALTKQYVSLLKVDGIEVFFHDSALDEIAHVASEVNSKTDNIGARRLQTIMERLLEDILFEAPESPVKRVEFDAAEVRKRLRPLLDNLATAERIL
jgi:ATP-dependent HslUV protease ATP-binding subunit HslU